MSLLLKSEKSNLQISEENLSNRSNYLWSEINTEQKYQTISTSEDYLINNNINQILQILEVKSILDSKFYLTKKIGQGSSGKVYLGFPKESLNDKIENIRYYSIKIMDTAKINLDEFKNEINLLEKINHKNILKIFAYGYGQKISLNKLKNKKPKEYFYIVMEYLEHGELFKYITNVTKEDNIGFGENFGRLIFSQLLDGLEAMHNLNICHRDIKLNNILIGDNDYTLKYVDFGMAIETQSKLESFLGTPNYAAPELHLKRAYYGKSEDIFSLGVTLFVLVTGRLPFKLALPNDILYQYIVRGDYIEFWKKQSLDVSPSFMDLFDNMIAFDYSQRPSISEIRQSAWMKEINWDLMPLLKQEFILREEKIRFNEDNKRKIIIDKNKSINLQELNKLINNKNIINSEEVTEESNQNKDQDTLKLKTRNNNLFYHINNIKKFLRKNGYIKFGGNIKKYELEVTNGEVDVFLNLQKYKNGYIKLNYYKINGTSETFEMFKKLIVNIRSLIDL